MFYFYKSKSFSVVKDFKLSPAHCAQDAHSYDADRGPGWPETGDYLKSLSTENPLFLERSQFGASFH